MSYSGDDNDLLRVLQSDSLFSRMTAVQTRAVVSISDGTPLAAALTPSPLGIPWSLDQLTGLLTEAAAKAG